QSSHKVRENAFYVRFTSSPFTSSANHIEIQHANFYKELNKSGIDVKIKNVFKRYTNVISIETDERNVKRIAEIEHVESVEPGKLYKRIEFNKKNLKNNAEDFRNETVVIAPDNDINAIHEITGVEKVRETLKLSGKGVRVGIIDSGIDYTHPALGGCFGPGCRVAFGYNFLDDNNDPYDCAGHGTFVTGIIGGIDLRDDGPGFVAYKVLPLDCPSDYDANGKVYNIHGQEFLDMVMKAIIMAVDDGMDIINLSLGPLAIMINDLAKYKGIIFISAAGNDGILGVFTSLMPSDIQNTISVGSFRTDKVLNFKAFDPKNPEFVINYITRSALAFPFQSANVKLFPMNKCSNDYKEFINTLIIIDFRENLSCIDIMIRFNNETLKPVGRFLIFPEIIEEGLPDVSVRNDAMIDSSQADILIQYLEKNTNLELDFSDKYGYMEYKSYSVVPSVFSSWGLSVELDIKPEISAPGQHMFSTFLVNLPPYILDSGTSFSSPYIAGIAALYIEVFGKPQSYEQLKVAFMNNAVPYKDRNNLLAPVVIQGAGFVDAFKLLKATSFVYPPKINLNDTVHFNGHHTLKIYNVGRKEMKYKLSHLPAPSFNGYNKTFVRNYINLEYFPKQEQCAGVEFDYNRIAVPPKSNVEVSVTFTLPKKIPKDLHLFYSGWLEIIPVDENIPTMTVPYAGLADDARSLPLFQTPRFPVLVNLTRNVISKEDPIATFTLKLLNITDGTHDYPFVLLNLATPTSNLITEILDANNKFLGWVKYFTGIKYRKKPIVFIVHWDGLIHYNLDNMTEPGTPAPDGDYFIRIKALKMFGDINNEKEYETWVSPKFKIKRSA
ncbi:4767_t:CDS:2, partial [Funneliformis caledonium]